MPLVGVNPVAQPAQKPTALDRVAQAFQIAQAAMGTALAIPEFLQKRDTAKLQQAESKTNIGQNTEIAQPGEPGSFEVPGMGVRKPAPNFARAVQALNLENTRGDIAEDQRKRTKLTPTQKLAYQGWLQEVGIKNIRDDMIPQTVGGMEEDRRARLGAMQITPQQNREFEYKVGKDIQTEEKEKQSRYIPSLDQYALTAQDAKDTKEAIATKNSITKSVKELVDLRTRYGGGNVTNREDVAKAKQIATKLLLKYKKMEGLGVLSKTDMELINNLVPQDPLELNPSGLVGQDPTMAKLNALASFLDDDIEVFLESRGFKPIPSGLTPDQEKRRQELLRKQGK